MKYDYIIKFILGNSETHVDLQIFHPSNWADVPEMPCCVRVSLRDKREDSKSTATLAPSLTATLASGGWATSQNDENDPAIFGMGTGRVVIQLSGEHRKIHDLFIFWGCKKGENQPQKHNWNNQPVSAIILRNSMPLMDSDTCPAEEQKAHWSPILNG